MKKFKKEKNIIEEIANELKMDKRTVMLIIKIFFKSIRKNLSLNKEINIKGFFSIDIKPYYKRKIKLSNGTYNPRKRISYVEKVKKGWLKKEQRL